LISKSQFMSIYGGNQHMIGIVFQTRKKYKNLNNSTSSNPYEMKYGSFESSHQDKSNSGKIKSLASKYHKIIYAKHILKNWHQKSIY
jgi:hypothetical protein